SGWRPRERVPRDHGRARARRRPRRSAGGPMSGTSESQVPAASTAADDDGATVVRSPRPGPATWRGSLLLAELGRLRHRRLVQALLLLGVLALLAGMAVTFATHSTDLSGARAEARQMAAQVASDNRRYEQECLA